jgi:hypothetical protein
MPLGAEWRGSASKRCRHFCSISVAHEGMAERQQVVRVEGAPCRARGARIVPGNTGISVVRPVSYRHCCSSFAQGHPLPEQENPAEVSPPILYVRAHAHAADASASIHKCSILSCHSH